MKLEVDTVIDRPIDEVFAYAADFSYVPDWADPGHEGVRLEDRPALPPGSGEPQGDHRGERLTGRSVQAVAAGQVLLL